MAAVPMENDVQDSCCYKLEGIFGELKKTLNPRLSTGALFDMGLDIVQIDLFGETERGGAYFFPKTQRSLVSLNEFGDRPKITLKSHPMRPSAVNVQARLLDQVLESGNDDDGFCAMDFSPWEPFR
jgi:hypothetical protein